MRKESEARPHRSSRRDHEQLLGSDPSPTTGDDGRECHCRVERSQDDELNSRLKMTVEVRRRVESAEQSMGEQRQTSQQGDALVVSAALLLLAALSPLPLRWGTLEAGMVESKARMRKKTHRVRRGGREGGE